MKLAIAPLFSLSLLACSVPQATDATSADVQRASELRACGLISDSTIDLDADIHACDAGQTRKTTICHIPPGNPSNAHTLCVGNAAVAAHVEQHHDTIGACVAEPPCDSGDDVDAGVGGGSGSSDDAGSGGVIF
jgi:hypothetical protein